MRNSSRMQGQFYPSTTLSHAVTRKAAFLPTADKKSRLAGGLNLHYLIQSNSCCWNATSGLE